MAYVDTLNDGETPETTTENGSWFDGILDYGKKVLDKGVDYSEKKASDYVDQQVNKLLNGDSKSNQTNPVNSNSSPSAFEQAYGMNEINARALIGGLTAESWKAFDENQKNKIRTLATALNVKLPDFTNDSNTSIVKNQYAPMVASTIATGAMYWWKGGWMLPLLVGAGVYYAYDSYIVKANKK